MRRAAAMPRIIRATSEGSLNRLNRILGSSSGSGERRVTSPQLSSRIIDTTHTSMWRGRLRPKLSQTSPALMPTAGQVSWMSGRSPPGSVVRKTWPAQALVANRPLRNSAHCRVCISARSSLRCELAAPGRTGQPVNTSGCSTRLRPTPGRSTSGSMPMDFRCSPGPTPDSISSCGEP